MDNIEKEILKLETSLKAPIIEAYHKTGIPKEDVIKQYNKHIKERQEQLAEMIDVLQKKRPKGFDGVSLGINLIKASVESWLRYNENN